MTDKAAGAIETEGAAPVEGDAGPAKAVDVEAEKAVPAVDKESAPVEAPADEFDWRTLVKDDKARKAVEKYNGVDDVAKALLAARQELSKRPKALEAPGEDATPEQVAEWRKSRGAPEAPDGYLEGFTPPDHFVDELHKPVLAEFAKTAHELNMPTADAVKLRDWYFDMEARTAQEMNARALEAQKAARIALTTELGGAAKFEQTMEAAERYGKETAGADEWVALAETRFADGTRLGDNPVFLRVMGQVARDAYGEDLVTVTGDRESQVGDLEARIKPLDDKMLAALKNGPQLTESERAEHQRLAKAIAQRRGGRA